MLKYKFKSYYPENSIDDTVIIDASDRMPYGSYYTKIRILNDTYYTIRPELFVSEFNLMSTQSIGYIGIEKIINHCNDYKIDRNVNAFCYSKKQVLLTNIMFLKELNKHDNLLSDEIFISYKNYYIDFKNATHTPFNYQKDLIKFERYTNSDLLVDSINIMSSRVNAINIIFKEGIADYKYKRLLILYLKCLIICTEQCYRHMNCINSVQSRFSGLKRKTFCIRRNNIKRFCSNMQNASSLINENICLYSNSKSELVNYLYLSEGLFISKFHTYDNLQSINERNTLIGYVDRYLDGNTIKFKIIISKEIIEYFSFLKKHKKDGEHISDYNKLNKALNAIKSIATLMQLEIEIIEIENKIYPIELSVNNETINSILDSNKMNLIPKNINQALEIKSIFDDLKNAWDDCSDFFSKNSLVANPPFTKNKSEWDDNIPF